MEISELTKAQLEGSIKTLEDIKANRQGGLLLTEEQTLRNLKNERDARTKAEAIQRQKELKEQAWLKAITEVHVSDGFKVECGDTNKLYVLGFDTSIPIEYNERVYRGSCYSSERTDMAYKVYTSPARRFATMQQAVDYAVKKMTEEHSQKMAKKHAEDTLQEMVRAAQDALAKQGLPTEHKTDWVHPRWRGEKGYESHRLTGTFGKVTFNADITDRDDVRLMITNLDFRFNAKQLKRLSDFIAALEKE